MQNLTKIKSKSSSVYEILREEIISNELKPGTMLVERALCEAYDSSRTPVREALRLLSKEGLVNFVPGYSAYVSYITFELITDLYDVREVLEGLSARLCAEHIGKKRLAEFEEVANAFKERMEARDYKEALKIDIEMHTILIQESRNEKLEELLIPVFNQSKRITNLTYYTDEWAKESLDLHLRIFEAIRDGKAALAEEVMREHIRISKKRQIENLHRYKVPKD